MIPTQLLHEDAQLPRCAHPGDAGFDLFCIEDITIPSLGYLLKLHAEATQAILLDIYDMLHEEHDYWTQRKQLETRLHNLNLNTRPCEVLIPTGVAMAIPRGQVGLIWDRSGLGSRGLKVLGGVIDEAFRGEIKVMAINLGPEHISLKKGSKVAQMIIQDKSNDVCQKVDVLDDTERGVSGFGSTDLASGHGPVSSKP